MDGSDDILAYVAFLAAGLCDAQEFTPSTWTEVLTPYMTNLFPSKAVANDETLEKFHLAAEKATVGIDDTNSIKNNYGLFFGFPNRPSTSCKICTRCIFCISPMFC